MPENTQIEIVKVEVDDRHADKPDLIVTAKNYRVEVQFKVPARLKSSYVVGRQVRVQIDLVK